MSIVERLRQHALPDPHDEREVMHAPLLKEAADLIEQQAERIKELEAERDGWREDANVSRNSIAMLKDRCNHFEDTLAALRQRIADAPVVAWNYYYPNIGGGRNASTHLIPGVSPIGADALIRKEDLK